MEKLTADCTKNNLNTDEIINTIVDAYVINLYKSKGYDAVFSSAKNSGHSSFCAQIIVLDPQKHLKILK